MFNELLKNVMNLGIITDDDVKRLTSIELMMLIIERTNGLLNHVENVDEKLANLLENIETTTAEVLHRWTEDGTFDTLLNQSALKKVNDRIDETNAQLSLVATEYYLSDDTTLNKLIELMPSTGGTIIIPSGEFYVNEDVILNKPITIKGYGDESVLVMNKSIISDTNPLNSLYFKDFKVITSSTNPAFILDKRITGTIYDGNPTLNTDLRIEDIKFYTELTNGTFIKIKQLCNSSIVNTIFQCKNINTSGYNGLDIESDGKLGIRNLSIENCKFVGLDYAIKVVGDEKWYTHTCGLMVNNTLVMDCNYGLYAENVDWVTFENGMLDYTDYPIRTVNVSNLKVKNNYIFSRRREVSSACVEYIVKNKTHCLMPEIVGNHMWNSSYGNLLDGVITTGVLIKVQGVSALAELIGGIISKNTIHRVTRCISLITENHEDLTAKIKNFNIEGNNFYMANRAIYSKGVIQSTIAPNNTFNTIVKSVESESDIPLSNTLSKIVTVNLQGSRYGQTATGIPHQYIQSVNLLYTDDVFTFKANAYLKENSDIVGVMTVDQVPGERVYSFKVEVKYTPSW